MGIFLYSTESSDDYSSVRTTLRFNECDTRKCQRINFINDLTTENTERFRVTISETTNFDSRIILVPDEAHVTITDADSKGLYILMSLLHWFFLHSGCGKYGKIYLYCKRRCRYV